LFALKRVSRCLGIVILASWVLTTLGNWLCSDLGASTPRFTECCDNKSCRYSWTILCVDALTGPNPCIRWCHEPATRQPTRGWSFRALT
jgi:hypothetical protein